MNETIAFEPLVYPEPMGVLSHCGLFFFNQGILLDQYLLLTQVL